MKFMMHLVLSGLLFLNLTHAVAEDHKRSKSINFEDELVEGINRKPLDAFNQISERNQKSKNHLYKKRARFLDRDEILFSEMRLIK